MTRDINYAIIFSMNAMLKGVYLARKKDNSIYYRASITYRRKHISLGSFDTEDSPTGHMKKQIVCFEAGQTR